MPGPTELAALDELIDALDEADDLTSGVIGLAEGRFGGDVRRSGRSFAGRLGSLLRGGREDLAVGFASSYGRDQLRKAVAPTRRLSPAVRTLSAGEHPAVRQLSATLADLRVTEIADELAAVEPRSLELRALHARLLGARSAAVHTRTRLELERRRGR